ncbi:hypothetical protein [Helcococcus bovis]|uniref:hypothetical protein n=1 Tax=Helcococcus bovis TaxID=3153252 RepID=UPI0038BA2627
MLTDEQTNKDILVYTFKAAKLPFDIIKFIASSIYRFKSKLRQNKYYKDQREESKFRKAKGNMNYKQFVKKHNDFQVIDKFANYDQKLINKIAKRYNIRITAIENKETGTIKVLIGNANPEKVQEFCKEYQKEYERKIKQKEKAKDFEKTKDEYYKEKQEKEKKQDKSKDKEKSKEKTEKAKEKPFDREMGDREL